MFQINSRKFILNKVLYVPRIKKTLISITKLCNDLNCYIEIAQKTFTVKSLKTNQTFFFSGINKRGLYYFSPDIYCNLGFKTDADLWHRRLGHPSLKILSKVRDYIGLDDVELRYLNFCNNCPMAKMTKLPFQYSHINTSCPLEILYIDLWGPSPTLSKKNFRFFATIVDNKTRYT